VGMGCKFKWLGRGVAGPLQGITSLSIVNPIVIIDVLSAPL